MLNKPFFLSARWYKIRPKVNLTHQVRVGSSCSSPVSGLIGHSEKFIHSDLKADSLLNVFETAANASLSSDCDSASPVISACRNPDYPIISNDFDLKEWNVDSSEDYSSAQSGEFRPIEDVELLFENVLKPIMGLENVHSEKGITYGKISNI